MISIDLVMGVQHSIAAGLDSCWLTDPLSFYTKFRRKYTL